MLPVPISKTKIIPPRRRDELLERKRLLDMLFDALDNKLVLVSAPAGYGKTSLLIDLVKQSEFECCWLSLDELDRDPQRFIAYFIASIAEHYPGFGTRTNAVMHGITSIEDEIERITVTLVNECFEFAKEHFVLIIDDFHILEDVKPIYELLNRFIQLVDDNCHIVISSRTLTTLPNLSLMVAREQVSGLSFFDLSFQKNEIQALILQNHKTHISDQDAQRLIDETEGWITGLQFSGNNFVHKEESSSLFLSTGVGLFDFIGQQVVGKLQPNLQEFLLRTSIMDEFDAELCEMVLANFYEEQQDWDGYIKAITQNNLFALPVGTEGRSLRYHHLFRDYLRARLEREKKDEIKSLLKYLGRAYESMGEWEKAHYVIKQLDDLEELAGNLERASYFMLQRSLPIIESWLKDLPPSILMKHPGVFSVSGTIKLIKGNLQDGLDLLSKAIEIFRKNKNTSGLALALIRRAAGYRYFGNYVTSIQDVDEAIELTRANDDLQIFHAEALQTKGLSLYRFGQARNALDFFERSFEIFKRLDDKLNIPILLMETGMAYDTLGKYAEAESAYEKALSIWKQSGNIWSQAGLLNNMGAMYHQQGEYEKSALVYEEGLLCAQRSGNTRMDALISIGLGDLYTELQNFEVAIQRFQHAEEIIQGTQDFFLLFSLNIGLANLALLRQDITSARMMINKLEEIVKANQSHYENGYLNLLHGKLFMFEDNPSSAVQKLIKAREHFMEDGREIESYITCVWLSSAYHRTKENKKAIQELKTLVGTHNQITHVVLVAIAQSRTWLEGLQKDKEFGRVFHNLLRKSEKIISKWSVIRRELRWHTQIAQVSMPQLTIQALGRSIVSVDGKILSTSDWQTQSVRDLFFFFLTNVKPLTKEQIAETLWPEIDEPSKIKLRFKNEMYRLRRAVGQDVILFEDIVYSFNRNIDYEYDVEAFESYLSRAKSEKDIQKQINAYRKAVDLVRGPYLDDIYFDWVFHDRERLSQAYLNTLISLADLYQRQTSFEEALLMCQRAIDYDPTFESAYYISMQIYDRLGDRSAVKRTYQSCSDALQQLLALPPSKQTKDLYHKLV